MRTNEERLNALHARAHEIKKADRRRTALIIEITSVAVCVCILAMLAAFLPDIAVNISTETSGMHASIFTNSSHLGHMVIGIVAFLLGIVLTVLCFSLSRWQKQQEKADSYT